MGKNLSARRIYTLQGYVIGLPLPGEFAPTNRFLVVAKNEMKVEA
jgi:hypothetical protein